MSSTPNHAMGALRFVLAAATLAALSGCRVEGRSSRAELLLSQLAPTLQLGEPLSEARSAVPALRVRHPGDATDLETAAAAAPPRPVAVIVAPTPQPHEHAAPDAAVEGVEFVMSPEVARRLRPQIAALFRGPGSRACAIRSVASADSIVEWELDIRGGALLTFPQRRADGAAPPSRLFVFTGAWRPPQSLSGYRATACDSVP